MTRATLRKRPCYEPAVSFWSRAIGITSTNLLVVLVKVVIVEAKCFVIAGRAWALCTALISCATLVRHRHLCKPDDVPLVHLLVLLPRHNGRTRHQRKQDWTAPILHKGLCRTRFARLPQRVKRRASRTRTEVAQSFTPKA